VVQLVGFCNNDGWFQRGRGLYVCSEFISNGPLDKYIFGTSISFPLSWSCSSYIFHAHFGNYTIQSNLYIYIYVLHLCICLFAYWIVYMFIDQLHRGNLLLNGQFVTRLYVEFALDCSTYIRIVTVIFCTWT
jgi:hypothetical protein